MAKISCRSFVPRFSQSLGVLTSETWTVQPGFRLRNPGILSPTHWTCCSLCFGSRILRRKRLNRKALRQRHTRHHVHIGNALARRASETRQTALLVDADQHIRLEDDLANALLTLDREGKFVRTTVFGAFSDRTRQRLSTSPKLRQYCQYGKDFHVREVPRLGNEGQPNDEAIIHEVRMLSEQSIQVECIALLVSDGDFALAVQDAVSHGKEVVVFVPEMNPAVEKVFQSTGARVVRLPPHTASEARASKIRATLKAEGTGYVKTTGPVLYKQLDSSSMRDFLSHFSYCAPDARPDLLCPAMAKFWFTNKLGDAFTVYPYQAAVLDLKRMLIEHHGRQWEPYQQNLAFFLPTKGGRRPSKEARENYGPGFGPSVHEGGGPFMLNDSDNLVSEALQKLGFLDQDLNSDFVEAMLVFCNTSNNKGALLRMGLLPSSASTAQQNLRQAFLSSSTGMWEGPPSDVQVRMLLAQKELLAKDSTNKQLVFWTMKSYVQNHGLPEMSSYHGLVWRILRSVDRNPRQRGTVEFTECKTCAGERWSYLISAAAIKPIEVAADSRNIKCLHVSDISKSVEQGITDYCILFYDAGQSDVSENVWNCVVRVGVFR